MKLQLFWLMSMLKIMQILANHRYRSDKNCKTPCHLNLINSLTGEQKQTTCKPVRHTPKCVSAYSNLTGNRSKCHPRLLHFQALAYKYVAGGHVKGMTLAYLNLSAIILQEASAVKFELECIHWEQNEDLCIIWSPENSTKSGQSANTKSWPSGPGFHWPCRLFDFANVSKHHENFSVQFPVAVHYPCLTSMPWTQFRVNVSVFPQNCESSYFMAIPPVECLEPDVDANNWYPSPVVDTTDQEKAWIILNAPTPKLDVGRVKIELYRENEGRNHHEKIFLPNPYIDFSSLGEDYRESKDGGRKSGFAFPPLPRGKYAVKVVFVERDVEKLNDHCQRDLWVYFWLDKDNILYQSGRGVPPFHDYSLYIGFGILLLVVMVFLGISSYIYYIRCRQRYQQNLATSVVECDRMPKVLILYTDDTVQHRECVIELAKFLQTEGRCKVFVDEWALSTSGQAPDHWLFTALEESEYYLIIFSEGSRLAFRGQELEGQRHWMELFNPGVMFVLQELLNDCRKRSPLVTQPLTSYLWLHFSYSHPSCIEPFLSGLPVSKFLLPYDLRKLLCHLHNISYESVDFAPSLVCDELQGAVSAVQDYYETHPNWLSDRLQPATHRDPIASGNVLRRNSDSIARIAADLQQLDFRGFGGENSAVLLNVDEAFACYRNRIGAENPEELEHLAPCERRKVSDGTADGYISPGRNSKKNNTKFELFPPDSEAESALLEPKFEVIGSPDDFAGESESDEDS